MSRHLVAILLVGGLVASMSTLPAAAQVESETYSLADGEWRGIAVATGGFEAIGPEVDVFWEGILGGGFRFTVSGDSVSGTWNLLGGALQSVVGVGFEAIGPLEYSGGGSVSGTDTQLVLDGNATTVGTVTAEYAGNSVTVAINNTNPLPTLRMDVYEQCGEAYGAWDATVVAEFEAEGFQQAETLKGVFVGFQSETGVSEMGAAVLAEAGYQLDPQYVDETLDLPEVLALMSSVTTEIAQLLGSFPDWTYAEVADTIGRANTALNALRNLNDCELAAIGSGNVETWVTVLTILVQRLVLNLVDLNLFSGPLVQSFRNQADQADQDYNSDAWQMLVQMALGSGAMGSGAVDLEAAAATEDVLRKAGAEILAANIDSDGSLSATAAVTRVLATGAAMNWTFSVDGQDLDPRQAFADLAG